MFYVIQERARFANDLYIPTFNGNLCQGYESDREYGKGSVVEMSDYRLAFEVALACVTRNPDGSSAQVDDKAKRSAKALMRECDASRVKSGVVKFETRQEAEAFVSHLNSKVDAYQQEQTRLYGASIW